MVSSNYVAERNIRYKLKIIHARYGILGSLSLGIDSRYAPIEICLRTLVDRYLEFPRGESFFRLKNFRRSHRQNVGAYLVLKRKLLVVGSGRSHLQFIVNYFTQVPREVASEVYISYQDSMVTK